MKRRRLFSLLAVLTAVVTLGVILVFVAIPIISRDANSPTPTQMVASASDNPDEGISVHGHWIIEVKNPDDTLADRREFDNSLDRYGREVLVKLLARQKSVGGWFIYLYGLSPSPFTTGFGIIVESTNPDTRSNYFKTLTVSIPTSGDNAGKLVLSGTATAQADGNIGAVGTQVSELNPTEAPSAIYRGDTGFTHSALGSSIPLTTGQIVIVTVVIDFS